MQLSNLTPVNDICIIDPVMAKENQDFGFTMTDANKDQPIEGKVVSVSENFKLKNVKVGDVVIWKKYSARELTFDGKLIFAAESEDIIAVIND
jgi:co-chaperonin GroES (HSP10)